MKETERKGKGLLWSDLFIWSIFLALGKERDFNKKITAF